MSSAAAANQFVGRIEIEGDRHVSAEYIFGLIHTRAGGPYDEDSLQRDLMALRREPAFEGVSLEVENDPTNANEKIPIFHVVERPLIGRIEYSGLSSVSESEITNLFNKRKIDISKGSLLNPAEVDRAEAAIRSLLAERGYRKATVTSVSERIPATPDANLVFKIDEGPLKSKLKPQTKS
jgi:outer membrane protein insertion porin family